jgi:hypothetical protein
LGRHTHWKATLAAALAASVMACESSEPEALATVPEIYCDARCEAEIRCENRGSQDSCRRECVADRPGLIHISPEAAPIYSGCIREFTCAKLQSDEAFDACWDSTKTQIEATPVTRSLCQTLAPALFECGYSLSTEECEGIFGMWADGVLDQVMDCTGIPDCDALDACIENVFDSL